MTTSNPLFHQVEGLVIAPMAPARFNGWRGFFLVSSTGETAPFWSPYRISTGRAISATKTVNDSLYLLDERLTHWLNGEDPDADSGDGGFVQGILL